MMKKIITIFLVFVLLLSCTACANGGGSNITIDSDYGVYNYDTGINLNGAKYKIVEDGIAKYSILIPDNSSEEIASITAEFNQYVFEVSGTFLPIVKDSEVTSSTKFISFGETEAKKATNIDTSSIKHDGFAIKTINGNVYLAANLERGVRYASYSLLERFLGIRWLTELETYVPTNKTITVQECDIVEEPLFAMRDWMNANYTDTDYNNHFRHYRGDELWCKDVSSTHNTTDQASKPGIGWVNKSDIAPDGDGEQTLGELHPEYFTDATNKGAADYDLCFTNGIDEQGNIIEGQNVTSLLVAKMKRFLAADAEKQEIQYVMVGHVDNGRAYCLCETCVNRRELYKDSGVHIIFLNAIIDEVNSWLLDTQGREITMVTFAYQYTETPPVKEKEDGSGYEPLSPLVVCDENIAVRIAPIDADFTYSFSDERQDASQKLLFEGWPVISNNFMIWDYACNFADYLWYFPDMYFLKTKIKDYKEMGVSYLMFQSTWTQKGIWHDDLRNYLFSKLAWNLDWDIDFLLNEYLELYYGKGSETVKAVINSYESFYSERRDANDLYVYIFEPQGCYLYNNKNQNPKEWITGIVRTLEEGIKNIESDDTLSFAEKSDIIYKLEGVMLTPMRMILRNYNSYYLDGKIDYAIKFFEIIDAHEITKMGEGDIRSVETRKRECGLA